MAHKYANVLVHIVFSTKERRNLIPPGLQRKLWKYIGGIGANRRIPVLAVGGMPNHLHILIALPSDVSVAKAVQTFKANSSRWIGEHGIRFAWQEGYGAFSVRASNLGIVKDYIKRQPEHHAKRTFEDEFAALLRKSGVVYEESEVFG
ncbi:MAG TPA: IS200/IS605 family transposase [Terriglobales bacterium]|nr:IS200/IS605 family transposase [Terriglobales bacterium]